MTTIEQRVKEILHMRLGMPSEQILTESRLVEDLGMDSLDAVELAIAMERAFDISISEHRIAGLKTVADVVGLAEELRQTQKAAALR